MITVLASNAYKAAYKVRKAATPVKTLPVSSHILIRTHEGRVQFIPFRFEERAEHAEAVPARIEGEEFATCVPARPFVDWLRATQEKPTRKDPHAYNDQIRLTFNPQIQILTILTHTTRAEFKCIDALEFPPC